MQYVPTTPGALTVVGNRIVRSLQCKMFLVGPVPLPVAETKSCRLLKGCNATLCPGASPKKKPRNPVTRHPSSPVNPKSLIYLSTSALGN